MNPADIPAHAQIQHLVSGFWRTPALYAAVRLGLPDLMSGEARAAAELAAACGADADSVRRLLRGLASFGICTDAGGGRFGLTALGETLRTDAPDSMRATVLHFGGLMWEAWSHLAESVRSGRNARALAGVGEDFRVLAADPEAAAVFNRAMAEMTRRVAAAVVQAYDLSAVGRLMDVGGGYGQLLATVLKANPQMRGVLFDLAHAAEGARRELRAAGVADRAEVVTGDFFQGVPAGADAYILKSIIHDWNDEHAATILRNCRRAAAPGARVLLVEQVAPERVESTPQHQAITMLDLNMMVGPGGRERTENEYRRLFQANGLKLVRIVPTSSGSAIIEAAPV